MGTTSKILAGYGVDGRAFYAPVTMAPGEIICPDCEGNGTRTYDNGTDGFSRPFKATCDNCDGAGVLEIEIGEDE
ncbi:MAG: hypothetical protein RLZZ104_2041 [Pseudomonadota bacterium]|jgi:DnaJ-class molecular chaperone